LAREFAPDILLLDEPTNNIDAQGRQWLENYIHSFRGSVVIASHDRTFLNDVVNQILEIAENKICIYPGDFDSYKAQKQKEFEQAFEKFEEYQSTKNRLLQVRNSKKAQSHKASHESFNKLKHEGRLSFDSKKNSAERGLGKQVKALESRIEQLEVVHKPKVIKQRSVLLDGENAKSKIVASIDNISKEFNHPVIENFSYEIRGGDRIHVTGSNGVGKTTLLQIISGLIEPDSGTVTLGAGIKVGYFSQDVEDIDINKSGLDNLLGSCDDRNVVHRSAAGFGFNERDLQQNVRELSRGQQAKIGFVKLLLDKNHLLVLDEPTNHLDIRTREQIEEALSGYNGAIIVSSHDQYFIGSIGCNLEIAL
jgi:ATPase subunit of ABC transporter with duplicated ATPase domains